MKIPDLASKTQNVVTGNDSIVIRNYLGGIAGGRTLDMEGFADDVVKAGHVIIRDIDKDEYKPMPVTGGSYGSLPSGCEYVGVLVSSVTKDAPFAGIMYAGEVNDVASPYPITSIKSALKTALPQLAFLHD